jgi:hypothetical protein
MWYVLSVGFSINDVSVYITYIVYKLCQFIHCIVLSKLFLLLYLYFLYYLFILTIYCLFFLTPLFRSLPIFSFVLHVSFLFFSSLCRPFLLVFTT